MNSTLANERFRLFGLDLAGVLRYFVDGWMEAAQWPALRWLKLDGVVRVVAADGTESFRRGVSPKPVTAPRRVMFAAIALDEAILLRRSITLPRLSMPEIRQAAALDAMAASPFVESELAWGFAIDHRSRDAVKVDIALTSRPLIETQVAQGRERLGGLEPEIWADGEVPIVLPGYGEGRRVRSASLYRRALLGLVLLALLLGCLRAITPVVQMRNKVAEANRKTEEMMRKVKPQADLRDELTRLNDQLHKLDTAARQRIDVLALLNDLTQRIPDDTMVTRFELNNGVVRISGLGDNAAKLIQDLGKQGAFREVRAPMGIARAPAGGKESFTIEFNVGAGAKTP